MPNQRNISGKQGLQQDTSVSGINAMVPGSSKAPQPLAAGIKGAGGPMSVLSGVPGDSQSSTTATATASLDKTKKIQFVASELKRMRYFRRQYDIRRAHFYRQYLGQRDERNYPDNVTKRSNTFVPYPFSTVENIISRVNDAFFTMEEWFETKDKPPYSEEAAADAMQLALLDKLHRASFIKAFIEFVRNVIIYGNSGIKVDWNFGTDSVTEKQPMYQMGPDGMTPIIGVDGQPIVIGYQPVTRLVPKNIPRFTIIDVYDLMLDPDGAYVAHLTERTWRDLKMEAEGNPNMYFPEGIAKLQQELANEENADDIIIRLAEFWNKNDNTWTIMTFGEDPEGISFKDLRASFRATAYSPYKRQMYGGESIMLWDGENPFFHKRCPILYTDFIKLPNEIFGLGAIEIITDLSEALNRFVNMISDNWNMGINHRYVYDINAEMDQESLRSFNVPGGLVGVVGDPSKVIMPLDTFTPAEGDYQILGVYQGMIEMASGVSDFYQKGVGGAKGNKTATGISQILNESNYRIKDFIRNLELDVLQPLLEMVASMIQQFVQEPFSAPNPQAGFGEPQTMMLQPEQLIGTYQFNIVASNYATSKVVRQRNLMSLASILENNPYINPYTATRELLKAFEIQHVDQLMKTPEQVQQEQQQQMQQQMQMMLIQHQLETDQKVKVAEATPPAEGGPPKKKKGGRKSKAQHEGQIPGAGTTSIERLFSQGMGSNALGLGQMGEIPGAG